MTHNPSPTESPSIRSLQTMLRSLSRVHREIPRIYPDGIFGEHTLEGVMVFQRIMDLPVDGRVDQTTWDALINENNRIDRLLAPPRAASLFPGHSPVLAPGVRSPLLYPVQGMLLALSQVFPAMEPTDLTGLLDRETEHGLRWLQRAGGQPESGCLDRETWDLLTLLFETFVVRAPQ